MDENHNSESGESNGFVHVEQPSSPPLHDHASVHQEPNSVPFEVDQDYGVVVSGVESIQDPDDVKVAEDLGKEEFVDCEDELVSFDGRSTVSDIGEAKGSPEVEQTINEDVVNNQSDVADSGIPNPPTGDELQNLQAKLEKTILEKENSIRDLQRSLNMKDQEIEYLTIKVLEQSVSRDVVHSYVNSAQENFSASFNVSSRVNVDKDEEIEAIADRVSVSLATALGTEELFSESVSGKMSNVERSASLLINRYNDLLSEIELLKQCLMEVKPDLDAQANIEAILLTARDELLELKKREVELVTKTSQLESDIGTLREMHNKDGEMVESANAEIGKLKAELEQEKTRYGNTKEKLSLAVNKGKALVQQRDSLKQSLAEKTSKLEKCLVELQENTSALEAAELRREELVKNESIVDSLQKVLVERDTILEKCGEILSLSGATEEIQSLDIVEGVMWLANERNKVVHLSIEFDKLTDALSVIDFPEVNSSSLESRVGWLLESYYMAKDDNVKLQDEFQRKREVAHDQIDRLTASLLSETQENTYLREELEDLKHKYEDILEAKDQASLVKEQMIGMLLEASGISRDELDDIYTTDVAVVVGKCFGKIKEQALEPLDSYLMEMEKFERIQSLLYVREYESTLYEQILEAEALDRSELGNLSGKFKLISDKLGVLENENSALQNDLQKSEEKASQLRERLSMAVKKGKGLVQERENMKQLLSEKSALIEQQESTLHDCRIKVDELLTDVERIVKLETELAGTKEQRDQLEQFLVESNSMLQSVIESIDCILIPADSEEPVEKVKRLAEYLNECQLAKEEAERNLGNLQDEAKKLESKLTEALETIKSLEDTLSFSAENLSQLKENMRDLETAKSRVDEELRRTMEESASLTGKYDEVCASRNSLAAALSVAENNISVLVEEKKEAEATKVAAEIELEKVRDEVSARTTELDEAYKTIQCLESSISQLQTNVSVFAEECDKAKDSRVDMETEIKKMKEDYESQVSKVVVATSTIKSLEDALMKAENNISDLVHGKKNAEQEINNLKEEVESQVRKVIDANSTIKSLETIVSDLVGEKKMAVEEISSLKSQISACMQDLAGKHTSGVLELSNKINCLKLLVKDETLSSLLGQSLESKFRGLKDMDLVINYMRDRILAVDSQLLQNYPVTEEKFNASNLPTTFFGDMAITEMVNGEMEVADVEGIASYVGKIVENFQFRNKLIVDKFENFSTFMDEMVATLSIKLQATRDIMDYMLENMKTLQQNVNNMAIEKQTQNNRVVILENNIRTLLSSYADVFQELKLEVVNNLLEMDTNLELVKVVSVFSEKATSDFEGVNNINCVKVAEELLSAARNVRILVKKLQNEKSNMSSIVEELKSELERTSSIYEVVKKEKEEHQIRISELETDLEVSQNLCNELRSEVKDYLAKADKLKETEAEVASLRAITSAKGHEAEDSHLSTSQMKILFDKLNEIEVPFQMIAARDLEHGDYVKKLFYIVDNVNELLHQTTLLSQAKEELESHLAKQALEVKNLKGEVNEHVKEEEEYKRVKNQLFELSSGLENLIQKLGGGSSFGDKRIAGTVDLLPVLERLVLGVVQDNEKSQFKARELGAKLLETQKVVDDLLNKVNSNQSRSTPTEAFQERAIIEPASLPSRSEISEIEETGPVGNRPIPPVPTAAHVRTLRKGSSDQLAINIPSESDLLIDSEETKEEKGHIFKSLNTSGLVPTQGKAIADRIDGLWVSGGQALNSRPRARLGLLAYWLLLHLWLLGTIL